MLLKRFTEFCIIQGLQAVVGVYKKFDAQNNIAQFLFGVKRGRNKFDCSSIYWE